MNFEDLRKKYNNFIYHDYKIYSLEDRIVLEYNFEIENLRKFVPRIEILKKDFRFNDIDSKYVQNIVFNIGMIEAISYYKATCSENFIIECGFLDEYQEKWFRKIFYLGLGEFRFINNIKIDENKFVKFKSLGTSIDKFDEEFCDEQELTGNIIPIGGGKDSNVTIELLDRYKEDNLIFCIGSKDVSIECAKVAGYKQDKIIEIKRIIDKNLLELNKEGYLNGHTPFSAVVAFITYLVASLLNKKNVVLSNEDSANETNVADENINHQYSKTIEFENDFREYAEKYLKTGVNYFSMLRPITEFEIAYLFSKFEKYHKIFKSCNVGSKEKIWKWCNSCPKCLFVYTILSPFLYKEKLINIFGEDLFEKEELLKTFIELCGYGETKPFECVGTFKEIRYAVSKTIEYIKENSLNMPYLLKYYDDNFEKVLDDSILSYYNENNNLPKEFEEILKESLKK